MKKISDSPVNPMSRPDGSIGTGKRPNRQAALYQRQTNRKRRFAIVDSMAQPAAARAFAAALERACHLRVCPERDGCYIRGFFDVNADAILTAYLIGFSEARRPSSLVAGAPGCFGWNFPRSSRMSRISMMSAHTRGSENSGTPSL